MTTQELDRHPIAFTTSQRRPLVIWLILAALAALVAWFGFRAYLNPDLLFHFANALYC